MEQRQEFARGFPQHFGYKKNNLLNISFTLVQEERNSALSEYRLVMSERDSVHKEMDKLQEDLLKAQEDGGKVKEDVERLVQEKEIVNHDLAIARSERDKVREGSGGREGLVAQMLERDPGTVESSDQR